MLICAIHSTNSLSNNSDAGQNQTANKPVITAADNNARNLHNNKCLQQLNDSDEVMVSAAFHDGAGGFGQLQELIDRQPWGVAVPHSMQQEIEKLLAQKSPFLMVVMTKKQALQLESHRDLIKWILVQSTEKPCPQ